MIASLSGILRARGPENVIIDVGGVGFKVFVTAETSAELGEIGSTARVYTHLHVRQEQLALFGFLSEEHLRMFELLLSVSGVGPKAAMNLLSVSPLPVLNQAITTGNAEPLTRIPGIGLKTAGRIVLELKGKVPAVERGTQSTGGDPEVFAALVSLGYTAAEADAAIRAIPSEAGCSTEARIIRALRHFAKP